MERDIRITYGRQYGLQKWEYGRCCVVVFICHETQHHREDLFEEAQRFRPNAVDSAFLSPSQNRPCPAKTLAYLDDLGQLEPQYIEQTAQGFAIRLLAFVCI